MRLKTRQRCYNCNQHEKQTRDFVTSQKSAAPIFPHIAVKLLFATFATSLAGWACSGKPVSSTYLLSPGRNRTVPPHTHPHRQSISLSPALELRATHLLPSTVTRSMSRCHQPSNRGLPQWTLCRVVQPRVVTSTISGADLLSSEPFGRIRTLPSARNRAVPVLLLLESGLHLSPAPNSGAAPPGSSWINGSSLSPALNSRAAPPSFAPQWTSGMFSPALKPRAAPPLLAPIVCL